MFSFNSKYLVLQQRFFSSENDKNSHQNPAGEQKTHSNNTSTEQLKGRVIEPTTKYYVPTSSYRPQQIISPKYLRFLLGVWAVGAVMLGATIYRSWGKGNEVHWLDADWQELNRRQALTQQAMEQLQRENAPPKGAVKNVAASIKTNESGNKSANKN